MPIILLVGAGAPLAGEEAATKPCVRSADFQGPEFCAKCHPRHYQEWRGSAHAYATVDPIVLACNRKAQRETEGKIGAFCLRCHATLGERTGELKASFTAADLLEAPPILSRGVSCEVCHRMQPPGEGRPIGNASFEMNDGKVFYGGLRRPAATSAHGSAESEFIRESKFCGSCHDVLHGAEALEKSFVEWSGSEYREGRSSQCQDCHMLRYSGQAAVGGAFRETLRRHNFPGVSVPLIPFPNRGYQTEEVRRFLRTAARMAVVVPEAVEAGAALKLTVLVKNSGAGHNLPTGISTFRQMWLEVTVRDEAGNALFRSGGLDLKGDLMDHHSELAPGGDPFLTSFSDRFLNEEGKEVLFLWQAARLDERSLKPLEERSAVYEIAIPASLEGSQVRAEVRLLFRFFAPYGLRAFELGELVEKVPIWEMDAFRSGAMPVLRRLPRRTEYSVPDDFRTLQAALDALQDGDRVLVAPGDYVLPAPLDFRGKAIHLQSRAGPDETVLRLDPGSASSVKSVVVFQGGERPAARLEGFTITGGSGTEIGGTRRGGGIRIAGSSPTIAGNRIAANQAAGGVGGGIACEGAAPAIVGNEFLGNWAGRGGAIAFIGPTEAGKGEVQAGFWVLRNNTFQGNVAEEGGALYVAVGARVRLERCLLAGNHAWDEGGALHAAAGAELEIDHSTLVFNKAEKDSGAIRAGPGSAPRVSNSIFWSNEPAAGAADFFYCLLDREAPDGAGEGAASGNRSGYPLFVDPSGFWDPAPAPEGLKDRRWPGTWRGGNYKLLPGSPAMDAADPATPADPDDSRGDMGAFFLEQPLKAFVRGDVDLNGAVTWSDLALLASHLLAAEKLGCQDAADLDDGGRVDPLDAIRLALFLLTGNLQPRPPFPDCALDPTSGEGLSCDRKAVPCR